MSSRYLVFCDIDDPKGNISQNVFDYAQCHPFAPATGSVEDDDAGAFHNTFGAHALKSVSFVAQSGCEAGGTTNGIVLEQTRVKTPLRLQLDEHSLINCLDQHGTFLYHHSTETASFGLSHVADGVLTDFKTGKKHTKLPFFNLLTGVKLGELPIYIVFMDSNRVANQSLWSTFYLKETDTRCSKVSDTSSRLKQELFDTVLLTPGCRRFGRSVVKAPGDHVELEIFGLDAPERYIGAFKKKRLPNFNEHLEVDASVPWSFTGIGKIRAELGGLPSGGLAYLKVHVKAGAVFESAIPRRLGLDTEFIFTK